MSDIEAPTMFGCQVCAVNCTAPCSLKKVLTAPFYFPMVYGDLWGDQVRDSNKNEKKFISVLVRIIFWVFIINLAIGSVSFGLQNSHTAQIDCVCYFERYPFAKSNDYIEGVIRPEVGVTWVSIDSEIQHTEDISKFRSWTIWGSLGNFATGYMPYAWFPDANPCINDNKYFFITTTLQLVIFLIMMILAKMDMH